MSSNTIGDKIAAVVNGGYIYISNDYGTSWTELTSSGIKAWNSIAINSTGKILAATVSSGYIYTSNDYGVTWTPRVTDAVRSWLSICINSTGDKLAACGFDIKYIYLSSNSGETWNSVAHYNVNLVSHRWRSICCDPTGTYLATVGEAGLSDNIIVSNDSGSTWLPLVLNTAALISVCCNNDFNRLIYCSSSTIFTIDYDKTTNTLSNNQIRFTSLISGRVVCSNNSGNQLGAVDNNSIYVSTNNGETWTSIGIIKNWVTICSISTYNKLLAGVTNDYIYKINFFYTYKGNIIENVLATGTNVTLTGYKINGTDMLFLTPFYKGTDYHAITDLSANIHMFKIAGSQPEICPAYILHADTGTGFSIPYGVTKMFVVCIGGGGGGGGGGVRGSGYTGGSAGGGGGGALNAWFITSVVGQITYTVTIGGGGLYGQPNNGTGIAEGAEDGAGNPTQGTDGANGGNTTFTYNSINYISNGGQGGHGGIGGSGSAQNGDGNGGAGGAVTSTPTPYASRVGANGVNGSISGGDNPGGIGGESGNKRGASQRFLINNSYINVQPFSPYTSATDPPAPNSTYNNDRICYGDGGRGGRSEGAGWGWAGYSGLKGCVIVFFYY